MADIFISYKREDRPAAQRVALALRQLGFDVWWDFELLSGDRYRKTIRVVIDNCKAAVVLWSQRSVESDFVLDEATHAKEQNKLTPARLDGVALPFGFGQVHTDDLQGWDGELSHPGFQALVRSLETRVGHKGRLGTGPSVEQQAAAAELDAFKAAQFANNATALRAFVKQYPSGMFATFVRSQMEGMADAPSAASPVFSGPSAQTQPSPHSAAEKRTSAPGRQRPSIPLILVGVLGLLLAFAAMEIWYLPGAFEQLKPASIVLPGTITSLSPDGFRVSWPDLLHNILAITSGALLCAGLRGRAGDIRVLIAPFAAIVLASWLASSYVGAFNTGNPAFSDFGRRALDAAPAVVTAIAGLLLGLRRS
ncbi:MAG TPA: toll/interleukin-1 receptor domain-containing protein [Hyphomonadaceae bacterium]|nr:toll/interleukin-1 receptor domain-containing protein [Hyphomonadaceae bacterium]